MPSRPFGPRLPFEGVEYPDIVRTSSASTFRIFQVVGVEIGERLSSGSGGFRLLLLAQRFEALFQHAAQGLLHNVASDEGGSAAWGKAKG